VMETARWSRKDLPWLRPRWPAGSPSSRVGRPAARRLPAQASATHPGLRRALNPLRYLDFQSAPRQASAGPSAPGARAGFRARRGPVGSRSSVLRLFIVLPCGSRSARPCSDLPRRSVARPMPAPAYGTPRPPPRLLHGRRRLQRVLAEKHPRRFSGRIVPAERVPVPVVPVVDRRHGFRPLPGSPGASRCRRTVRVDVLRGAPAVDLSPDTGCLSSVGSGGRWPWRPSLPAILWPGGGGPASRRSRSP
jgi:hypothetical protein